MNLPALIQRCKIKIPDIKTTGLSDIDLSGLINEGFEQVNLLCKAYRGYTDINVVNGQQMYALSSVAPTFQQIVTAGLWFSSTGLTKDLKRVIPRTEEWLNKKVPNWRSASAAKVPQYYYQSGDNLVLYPPVSSNIVKGMRLHHLILPAPMANDAFPFTGTAVEIVAFKPFDNAVVEYVRTQLSPSLNTQTGEDMSWPRFLQYCDIAKRQVKAKPDAINYYDTAVSFST